VYTGPVCGDSWLICSQGLSGWKPALLKLADQGLRTHRNNFRHGYELRTGRARRVGVDQQHHIVAHIGLHSRLRWNCSETSSGGGGSEICLMLLNNSFFPKEKHVSRLMREIGQTSSYMISYTQQRVSVGQQYITIFSVYRSTTFPFPSYLAMAVLAIHITTNRV